MIEVAGLAKSFVLHTQGGVVLPVLRRVGLRVAAGEIVVLVGPSGAGKSSLLKCIYGNYRADAGQILVRHDDAMLDIAAASPRTILDVRRRTIGWVSQFLRVVPRVPAIDIVAEPLRDRGTPAAEARARAAELLARLNVPERLWMLAPATFSGGEQQRINIARSFAVDYPILLLDEPTSALDAENRAVVAGLVRDAAARGAAVLGIFHDDDMRAAVAGRTVALDACEAAAA